MVYQQMLCVELFSIRTTFIKYPNSLSFFNLRAYLVPYTACILLILLFDFIVDYIFYIYIYIFIYIIIIILVDYIYIYIIYILLLTLYCLLILLFFQYHCSCSCIILFGTSLDFPNQIKVTGLFLKLKVK